MFTLVGVGGRPAESRTRGQVMADTLIERVTGQTTDGDVAVRVNLIMTDTALFNTGDKVNTGDKAQEPAFLVGAGGACQMVCVRSGSPMLV